MSKDIVDNNMENLMPENELEKIIQSLENNHFEIPLEILSYNPETEKKLMQPHIYSALSYAKKVEGDFKELVKKRNKTSKQSSENLVYPLVGNTIQMVFAYLNDLTLENNRYSEFRQNFFKILYRDSHEFISTRLPGPHWAMYVPKEFYTPVKIRNEGKRIVTLSNEKIINKKYDFVMDELLPKYLKKIFQK